MVLYAAALLPGSDYRMTACLKSVEVISTAMDRTLRKRKSQLYSDRLAQDLRLHARGDANEEDATGQFKRASR